LNQKLIITLLFFVVLQWQFSYAAEHKLSIVTEHSPPYQELNKNSEVVGFTTEIIKAALAHTSIDYDIKIFPWSRTYAMAKKNKNTCVYLIGRNKEREQLFQWLQPIVSTSDYLIGLKGNNNLVIKTLEDAKKYKVAVLKDDRTHTILLNEGFIENKNLYIVNNTYSLLKLLLLRPEIDLILADTLNVRYRAKFNGIEADLFHSFFKMDKPAVDLYFACSLTTDPSIIATINESISTIKNNGEYNEILHRWQMD